DELDEYLALPAHPSILDPLQHWEVQSLVAHTWPRWCLIICQFLVSSATSTDTECAFSGGGLTVSRMRHSLSDQSTHATSVLVSWASIKGMVPEAEIIQTFQNKKNR
ncbi:hypothetical protein K439DRAFT_1307735, partial [Ramaria rubella]